MHVHRHHRRATLLGLEAGRLLGVAALAGTWTYILGMLLGLGR